MPVDSHCHLNYPGLVEDQAGVIARAREAGVSAMLAISTRSSEWDDVIRIAEGTSDIWASVGVHPHEADSEDIEETRLVAATRHPTKATAGVSAQFSAATSPPRARRACR